MRLIIAAQISPFDYVSACLNAFGRQAFTHVNIQIAYSAFQYTFGKTGN
jgi:hypothetical protein